jgi:broad specificity phosphatase PhoE
MINRRHLLSATGWLALPARGATRQAPGVVLILRHAVTEPGVGDPPGYRLDRCSTQRQLSAAGHGQARALGLRLAQQHGRPSALLSSAWCRCLDTARGIADSLGAESPPVRVFDPLNSFFEDRSREPAQTAALRQRLASLRRVGGFEVWVTHQVNITALTDRVMSMGEGVWLGPQLSAPAVAAFPS